MGTVSSVDLIVWNSNDVDARALQNRVTIAIDVGVSFVLCAVEFDHKGFHGRVAEDEVDSLRTRAVPAGGSLECVHRCLRDDPVSGAWPELLPDPFRQESLLPHAVGGLLCVGCFRCQPEWLADRQPSRERLSVAFPARAIWDPPAELDLFRAEVLQVFCEPVRSDGRLFHPHRHPGDLSSLQDLREHRRDPLHLGERLRAASSSQDSCLAEELGDDLFVFGSSHDEPSGPRAHRDVARFVPRECSTVGPPSGSAGLDAGPGHGGRWVRSPFSDCFG